MYTAERHQSIDRALVDSLSAWLGVIWYSQESRADQYLDLEDLRPIGSDVPSAP